MALTGREREAYNLLLAVLLLSDHGIVTDCEDRELTERIRNRYLLLAPGEKPRWNWNESTAEVERAGSDR